MGDTHSGDWIVASATLEEVKEDLKGAEKVKKGKPGGKRGHRGDMKRPGTIEFRGVKMPREG